MSSFARLQNKLRKNFHIDVTDFKRRSVGSRADYVCGKWKWYGYCDGRPIGSPHPAYLLLKKGSQLELVNLMYDSEIIIKNYQYKTKRKK